MDGGDPRFFISTKRQRDVALQVSETEPHEVVGGRVFLASRNCVLNKRDQLDRLGIKHIVMCCDRAPDFPKDFEYFVIAVNNESRDSSDQHARHVHDDDDPHHANCSHASGCGDLHLTKWKTNNDDETASSSSCLAEEVCRWIDSRDGATLIHGFDGVSNSAAVATAYLMWNKKMRFSQAWSHLESIRPIVRLTPQLKHDLKVFDSRLMQSQEAKKLGRIVPKRANNNTNG